MNDAAKPSASICPLCGEDNRCAMVKTGPGENCWCVEPTFAEGLLDQGQAAANRDRCLCQACVEKAREVSNAG